MKNQIKTIISSKGVEIDHQGNNIKYFQIAYFSDIEFVYGITELGWLIKKNNNQYLVRNQENNYIPFFKLLELPNKDVIDQIKSNIEFILDENYSIFDYFPIVQITKTAINMESLYWANLCLDLLLDNELYNSDFLGYIRNKKEDKWISQSLRHKLLKYIAKTRT